VTCVTPRLARAWNIARDTTSIFAASSALRPMIQGFQYNATWSTSAIVIPPSAKQNSTAL
jgi:hypothetical protein